jgi:hypothetical protein
MVKSACSNGELEARIVALEANLASFKELMNERDERYKQRALSQDNAVKSALDTSEKAITKAESATEKRLEGLNELRAMAEDQAKDFSRKEVIEPKLMGLEDMIKTRIYHGGGVRDAWGQFAVAAGLVIAAVAVYFRH